jgi:hypothetical protein
MDDAATSAGILPIDRLCVTEAVLRIAAPNYQVELIRPVPGANPSAESPPSKRQ